MRFFAIATLLVAALSAQAETLVWLVVGVAYGDTITVLDRSNTQHKMRLSGIDAPGISTLSK